MFSITTLYSDEEIMSILTLLQQNLRRNLSSEKQKSNGFVSIEYKFDELQKLNQESQSVIAKNSTSDVIGYALAVLPESKLDISDLQDLITIINQIEYKNRPLKTYRYYILGQICVAEGYRGLMISRKMLEKHRELYSNTYQLLITAISDSNTRSLRAHMRIGFEIVHSFTSEDSDTTWHIVIWDWYK